MYVPIDAGHLGEPAKPAVITTTQTGAAVAIKVLPAAMNAMRTAMRTRLIEGVSVPQFRCVIDTDLQLGASLGSVLTVALATAWAMVERSGWCRRDVTVRVSRSGRRRSELHCLPAGLLMLATVREATQVECAELLEQHPAREVNALRLGLRMLK